MSTTDGLTLAILSGLGLGLYALVDAVLYGFAALYDLLAFAGVR